MNNSGVSEPVAVATTTSSGRCRRPTTPDSVSLAIEEVDACSATIYPAAEAQQTRQSQTVHFRPSDNLHSRLQRDLAGRCRRRTGGSMHSNRLAKMPPGRPPGVSPWAGIACAEGSMRRRRVDKVHSSHSDLLLDRSKLRAKGRFGSSHNLHGATGTTTTSPIISITTKSKRTSDAGCATPRWTTSGTERMVTIQCERLSRERQHEQVEIEIPLSVYNNLQRGTRPGQPRSRPRSATTRRPVSSGGLAHKIWRIFAKV